MKNDPCLCGKISLVSLVRLKIWNPCHSIVATDMRKMPMFKDQYPAISYLFRVRAKNVLCFISGLN